MPIYYDKAKRAHRFQFNRVIGGRRIRASRLLPAAWSQSQADAYDRQESARLYAAATGIEPEVPLISDAVALYLTHRVPKLKNKKNTAQNLALLVPLIAGRPLADLPQLAREYDQQNPGLAPATVRNRLAWLRAAVRYAYREHNLGAIDHTARMRLPRVNNKRHVYLRVEQMEKLRRACDDADTRAIIRIAFYTGCRWVAEILPRQPEDIVRIGRQTWLKIADTKNAEPKMVPVHPAIREDLKRLPFTEHWRTYYARFEAAREKAGMEGVNMHDLRHSLASALISQGETLAVVGKALGHKSAQSTERYAHLYPEAVARAVRKMPTGKKRKARKAA
jgi:integrase